MASNQEQRSYSAPCPGCGAPVNFASAQASIAVCPYCRSTVAREGEVLKRIGTMAEVFEDYSPLQLGATGMAPAGPDGRRHAFTLIGRLQMRSEAGTWSEWVALLDGDGLGFLSEDNGSFVWSLPWKPGRAVPEFRPQDWTLGREVQADGRHFTVASVQDAQLVSAQGQLADLPALGRGFKLVELRDELGGVLSLEFRGGKTACTLGAAVDLEQLRLQGLRGDVSSKAERGRHFNCPKCGGAVQLRFDSSKSVSCPSCGSLIDMSGGIGGELRYAEQRRGVRPQIPLGSQGRLDGLPWQVVGFQRRQGREPGDDESFVWDEYLLYNAKAGFAFIVDSSDGWSMGRVTSGAPKVAKSGESATYMRQRYAKESAYRAETLYVEGEFYWRVQQDQVTSNVDYVNAGKKSSLAQETWRNETTWTHAQQIPAQTLAEAFGLKQLKDRSAVGPAAGGIGCFTVLVLLFLLVLVLFIVRGCAGPGCDPRIDPNCSSSRSSGGSFGGYSSGGSHK